MAKGYPNTPAFIFNETTLKQTLARLSLTSRSADIDLLYSVKACPLGTALELISEYVAGFSCSSLFELRLVDEVLGHNSGEKHFTTPGLIDREASNIAELADYLSLNSTTQLARLGPKLSETTSLGLRVNPQISFVADKRYDPCAPISKLGARAGHVEAYLEQYPERQAYIRGLHWHNNCESEDIDELYQTVSSIAAAFPELLEQAEWINMGGGYIFDDTRNLTALHKAVELIRERSNARIYMEPGAAVIRHAGSIVSTVTDMFESGGKTVAVLDTTVNHMPEVLEYQFQPDVLGHVDGGAYRYTLVGCTCLAGDSFGESMFDTPLQIGSRVTITNMGAYTLSKAHMFNGVNLPNIYLEKDNGTLELIKTYDYDDFRQRVAGVAYVST